MATDRQIRGALNQKLLGRRNHEDPKRCELHAYILANLDRWSAPRSGRGWGAWARKLRRRLLNKVYLKGVPRSVISCPPRVVWGNSIAAGDGYRIRKVRYEGYPGMWIPALLYEPTRARSRSSRIESERASHGRQSDGLQAGALHQPGQARNARTEYRIPRMGELTMDRDRQRISQLDLCGIAGVSVFYLGMKRGLDVLLAHRNADRTRVAMTGLSGGGWHCASSLSDWETGRVIELGLYSRTHGTFATHGAALARRGDIRSTCHAYLRDRSVLGNRALRAW